MEDWIFTFTMLYAMLNRKYEYLCFISCFFFVFHPSAYSNNILFLCLVECAFGCFAKSKKEFNIQSLHIWFSFELILKITLHSKILFKKKVFKWRQQNKWNAIRNVLKSEQFCISIHQNIRRHRIHEWRMVWKRHKNDQPEIKWWKTILFGLCFRMNVEKEKELSFLFSRKINLRLTPQSLYINLPFLFSFIFILIHQDWFNVLSSWIHVGGVTFTFLIHFCPFSSSSLSFILYYDKKDIFQSTSLRSFYYYYYYIQHYFAVLMNLICDMSNVNHYSIIIISIVFVCVECLRL